MRNYVIFLSLASELSSDKTAEGAKTRPIQP
jgi:hypothetical protein